MGHFSPDPGGDMVPKRIEKKHLLTHPKLTLKEERRRAREGKRQERRKAEAARQQVVVVGGPGILTLKQ